MTFWQTGDREYMLIQALLPSWQLTYTTHFKPSIIIIYSSYEHQQNYLPYCCTLFLPTSIQGIKISVEKFLDSMLSVSYIAAKSSSTDFAFAAWISLKRSALSFSRNSRSFFLNRRSNVLVLVHWHYQFVWQQSIRQISNKFEPSESSSSQTQRDYTIIIPYWVIRLTWIPHAATSQTNQANEKTEISSRQPIRALEYCAT